ncbi:MAG: pyruvate dehydrogenase complex dihydrolipoamide acetyltransferase [Flavobacteriaceae bacterium]|nr:pyruvate dehydrogenase complex dihydrolipoamide acetyltransferase [Flavobacteriaceae bacterium]
MAEVVRLPKMSDTMTEGVIVKWNYKVGDAIKSGDILAEVETDKATMDMEVYAKGILLHLALKEGDATPVDSIIAVVGSVGESFETLLISSASTPLSMPVSKSELPIAPPAILAPPIVHAMPSVNASTVSETIVPSEVDSSSFPSIGSDSERLKASPLAKKLAAEKDIDLHQINGSGENGRIVKKDIESHIPTIPKNTISSSIAPTTPIATRVSGIESFHEVAVTQMRKTIAARLGESKFSAPHFYLSLEINMDKASIARVQMNAVSEVKISMNDLIIKAAAVALRSHPNINSSWLQTKIRYNHHIHIGVALAVEEGLLVPVVRFADSKSLGQISSEVKEYGKKAKEKKLQPQDWSGNTFTISNLGMFGIDEFTAIINPPDACILAVGAVKDTVGIINGEITPVKTMKVTLSCDHRVVDGTMGAKFLQTLKDYLEEPYRLLV